MSKQKWTEVKDTRMRYEQSHPMWFTGPPTQSYATGYDAIDWADGRPNQAKPRRALPHVKAKGRL